MKNVQKISCIAAIILGASSPFAFSASYVGEVSAVYIKAEDTNAKGLVGEFNFSPVSTDGHPLAESAFLEKSNRVELGYTDGDGYTAKTLGAELWLGNFYVAPGYAKVDFDGAGAGDTDTTVVALGYSPLEGLLIRTLVPKEDYETNLNAKYVMPLSGEHFLNLEAGWAKAPKGASDDTITVGGDFYFDRTFSVGAVVANSADTDYTVRADKFFTDSIRVRLSHKSSDLGDITTLSASFRF